MMCRIRGKIKAEVRVIYTVLVTRTKQSIYLLLLCVPELYILYCMCMCMCMCMSIYIEIKIKITFVLLFVLYSLHIHIITLYIILYYIL